LVEEDDGVRPRGNRPGDLGQFKRHSLGGAAGQDEAGAFALGWADGPKDVGRGCPLVLGR
jgi:hypothetical protein